MASSDTERQALAELRDIVSAALEGTAIRAWLFGSRARGDAGPFADVDIALEAEPGEVPLERLAALRLRIQESHVPYAVDLVDLGRAPAGLRASVQREGIPWIV